MNNPAIHIRLAEVGDIGRLGDLLIQVCNVHAEGRPDIFIADHRKYSNDELRLLITQFPQSPILVATTGEDNFVAGYAFCQIQDTPATDNTHARRTLYLDDLCVDADYRGQHIGQRLYEAVRQLAIEKGCNAVTLNVWACNPKAQVFYEHMGLKPLKTYLEDILPQQPTAVQNAKE